MKKSISIISIISMMSVLAIFPTNLKSENPEWMYFPELEDIRGMEAIDHYIYLGLAYPKTGIIRLNLENLKLDTIDPAMVAESFKQDSKGNVWIGTPRGLWETRDKFIINKYDHTNSNLKRYFNGPDLDILCIAIDKYDNKWLGTDSGLVRFDGVEGEFFHHPNKLVSKRFTHVLLDNDGESIWIWRNENYGGIMKFLQGEFINFDTSNSNIVNPRIRGLDIDNNNNLWMIGQYILSLPSSGKLIKYDGDNWEHYDMDNPSIAQLDTDTELKIDKGGTKWIGTRKGGLIKYDGSIWSQYNTENSGISGNRISRIVIDKYGNKWIATGSGINGFPALEVFREGGVFLPTNVQDYIREQDSKTPIVYPNPANEIIKVTDLIKRERSFEISNIMGKVLLNGTFYHEIDVSSLPTGFYFLKVDEFRLKFVKN
ncbi:MAG: T9SS type A sorting domain-containing protein [Candidatus Kapabacteria bacterium]|nr:T9SS type A sorting domain-containing protein [Candidatus Kapabacteria bacterium]